MATISQTTFSNAFSLMKIYLCFNPNWAVTEQATNYYLNQWWRSVPMHICITLPRWVNTWASYQIRKIAGCACAGNAGNVFPRHRLQRKPLVSDPGMHHGTCVTHVPCCMSGSLTRGGGENVPGIPGACTTSNITYLARGPLDHRFNPK